MSDAAITRRLRSNAFAAGIKRIAEGVEPTDLAAKRQWSDAKEIETARAAYETATDKMSAAFHLNELLAAYARRYDESFDHH